MTKPVDRRGFLKGSLLASTGAALGLSLEEQALMAGNLPAGSETNLAGGGGRPLVDTLPTGKIGDLTVSRIICGGNLIGGWAHARDLLYVSELLKNYFTDEKIMDTLEIAEAHGINTINTHPNATGIINRYWRERGGKIQWMVQAVPSEDDPRTSMRDAVDNGACAGYIVGNVADAWVAAGRVELIGSTLDVMRDYGVPVGVACHSLGVPKACEAAGIRPDFYMKTLHSKNYFSAQRPNQTTPVLQNYADNYWCMDPEDTIAFMESIDRPWIAYKVLAAGAIAPQEGFDHAFRSGADFACVGMFDFQIAEDVRIANTVLARDLNRSRPWRG